jgi:cytochrome c biogenesis protein CcmG/thiol:disulfide interchange protein DsbE
MSDNNLLGLRILIFIIFISVFGCQKADDGDVKAPEAKKTATQEIVPTRDTGDSDVNAPDFSLSDLSGRAISLKQYRGNVVILDFWATWCMPCRVSIPELGKLHEKYRDRGLVVLGISLDDHEQFPDEYLRAFRDKFGINYKILRYNISVIRDYFGGGNIAIPTMFLIDRKGRIREKIVGFRPDVLNKSLSDLL